VSCRELVVLPVAYKLLLLLQVWLSVAAAAAVLMVEGVDPHYVLFALGLRLTKLLPSAITWLLTIPFLLQGFVKHTKVGVYSMQQVWEQAPAQREIMATFLSDSRIKYELGSSQLALSTRDVDIVVKKAIKALVHSLQVSAPTPTLHVQVTVYRSPLVPASCVRCVERNSRSTLHQARPTMGFELRMGSQQWFHNNELATFGLTTVDCQQWVHNSWNDVSELTTVGFDISGSTTVASTTVNPQQFSGSTTMGRQKWPCDSLVDVSGSTVDAGGRCYCVGAAGACNAHLAYCHSATVLQ